MLACGVAFLMGGIVKGTLGVGLPLLAVPLMSLLIPSPQAIALVAVPVLASNAWQAVEGGMLRASLGRFWPLMVAQFFATVATVRLTLALSVRELNMMLAASVIIAVVLMALRPTFHVAAGRERLISALVGLVSGLMGGVSSLTGPVIITYLMALRLNRDQFVGCISIIYLGSAIPLYGAMLFYGRLNSVDLGLSTLALLPMATGLALGKRLRQSLPEATFRRLLFIFLIAVACLLATR